MAKRYNTHHIIYNDSLPNGGWTVELLDWMHQFISICQNMKASEENYMVMTNLTHALVALWNQMRMELDIEDAKKEK